MTDHANELRRYSRKIGRPAGDVPSVMLAAAEEIERLAAKLEEAESDALEQARLNGMGSEREAALMAKLEAAEKSDAESIAMYRKVRDERDALRVELNEIRYGVAVAHDTIKALRAKVEAAEKERDFAKAEIARLHDDIRELTDVRVLDEEDREWIVAHLQGEAKAKLDSLEATEKDSAHHKALAESALRVAKGWEDKCDELRAKIEHMEKQAPAAEVESWTNGSYSRNYKLRWLKDVAEGDRLYALPGAQGEW